MGGLLWRLNEEFGKSAQALESSAFPTRSHDGGLPLAAVTAGTSSGEAGLYTRNRLTRGRHSGVVSESPELDVDFETGCGALSGEVYGGRMPGGWEMTPYPAGWWRFRLEVRGSGCFR